MLQLELNRQTCCSKIKFLDFRTFFSLWAFLFLYLCTFLDQVLLVSVQYFVSGDRLENIHNAPATASFSGGHNSLLSLPLQTVSEYKNQYKGSASSLSTSSPLLHKTHYTPSTYNPSAGAHYDIVPIVKHANEPNNGDGSYSFR